MRTLRFWHLVEPDMLPTSERAPWQSQVSRLKAADPRAGYRVELDHKPQAMAGLCYSLLNEKKPTLTMSLLRLAFTSPWGHFYSGSKELFKGSCLLMSW